MIYAAEESGLRTLDQLLHAHDSLATWRLQYDAVGDFRLPATGTLFDHTPQSGFVPPVGLNPAKGRPSRKAKRAAAEEDLKKMEADLRDTLAAAKAKQTGLGDTAATSVPGA